MQRLLKHTYFMIIMVAGLGFISQPLQAQSNLAPALNEMLNNAVSQDSVVKVVILLEDNDRQSLLKQSIYSKYMTRVERLNEVTNRLRFARPEASVAVETLLDKIAVSEYTKYWIVPAYSVELSIASINELSAIEGVALIAPDASITYDPPVTSSLSAEALIGASDHLKMLKVPEVWARGLTGKGRLVCNFDTGVEQTHPALDDKWIGHVTGLESGWFSTIKPDSVPYDDTGHGTHTMGVMVGSIAADSFGVAPDARWMAAGVVDQGKSLGATFSDILGAFEWALNPDNNWATSDDVPDVILNSWGVPKGMFNPCDDLFWTVIDNVEAAGIVTIFAAGNEGPDPMTIRSPADRASTPFNTFSVGAVDNNYVVADFSSRGPSSCDKNQVKPEVMAPGVGVRSSTKNSSYAVMSGTSMAAPYIAGLVALAREYNPDATPEQIKDAMIKSVVDLGAPGEDNSYGYGFVDAEQMIENLPKPLIDEYAVNQITVVDETELNPGGRAEFTIEITNPVGLPSSFFGQLVNPEIDGISINTSRVQFIQTGDRVTAFNIVPFIISFDSFIPNGLEIRTPILLESVSGETLDTVMFEIRIGLVPPGEIVTLDHGSLTLSVSDYGQLGLTEGSIYNTGGFGFRFNGSDNLLYEAGIVIGKSGFTTSSALRNPDGSFRTSDFSPIIQIASGDQTTDGGQIVTAGYSDQTSSFALPLDVNFEAVDYSENADDNMIFLTYELVNTSSERLDSVYFGFSADFDLLGNSESIMFDDSLKMLYQISPEGPVVGLVFLENLVSATTVMNKFGKSGMSESDYYNVISSSTIRLESQVADDLYFMVGSGALSILSDQSVMVKMALIAGDDIEDLKKTAALALNRHIGTTGTNPGDLPDNFELHQNYPNPFNPSTTIALSLKATSLVQVEVFNILGQTVKQFNLGWLSAGRHEVIWDGKSDSGDQTASGVYLYKLSIGGNSKTRKMVLLQ